MNIKKVKVKVMDKMTIVGLKGVSFKDDKTDKEINGTSFFYTMEDEHTAGLMAGKFFLSAAKRDNLDYVPDVGDEVWVDYDRYGKPARFEKIGK